MDGNPAKRYLKWLPLVALLGTGSGVWAALNSRVAALETRAEDRKDDVSEIKKRVESMDQKMDRVIEFLLERRR